MSRVRYHLTQFLLGVPPPQDIDPVRWQAMLKWRNKRMDLGEPFIYLEVGW